jgi:hypothetical protein
MDKKSLSIAIDGRKNELQNMVYDQLLTTTSTIKEG